MLITFVIIYGINSKHGVSAAATATTTQTSTTPSNDRTTLRLKR
jgi:hypothetical protein